MLRHWGALLLATTLVAAAPIPKPATSQPAPTQHTDPTNRDAGGHKPKAQNDSRGTRSNPLVINVPRTKEEAAEHSAEAQERTEAASRANFDTWLTLILTVATVALAFFTLGLFRATAKAVSDAGKSIGIANKTLEHARESTRIELRAYLYVGKVTVRKFSFTEPIVLAVSVVNAGRTPAREFISYGTTTFAKLPLPDDAKFPKPTAEPVTGRHSKTAIFPGTPNNVDLPANGLLTPERIAELKKPNPKLAIYVTGGITYEDIFGQPRVTRFCRYINSEDAALLIGFVEGTHENPGNFEPQFISAHIFNDFT